MIIFFTIPLIILIAPALIFASWGAILFNFIATHKIIVSIILGIIGIFAIIGNTSDDVSLPKIIFQYIVNIVVVISFIFFIFGFSAYFLSTDSSFLGRLFGSLLYWLLELALGSAWLYSASDDCGPVLQVFLGLGCMFFAVFLGVGMFMDHAV